MNLPDLSKGALPSASLLFSFTFGSPEPEGHIHILKRSHVFKNIAQARDRISALRVNDIFMSDYFFIAGSAVMRLDHIQFETCF